MSQICNDQFLQKWHSEINLSSKCLAYRVFKTQLCFESYLVNLSPSLRVNFTKFRCLNIRLPIEAGSYTQIDRINRKFTKCDRNALGDEFHALFECPFYTSLRKKYLPVRFLNTKSVMQI